jgi:hypothetical protein
MGVWNSSRRKCEGTSLSDEGVSADPVSKRVEGQIQGVQDKSEKVKSEVRGL